MWVMEEILHHQVLLFSWFGACPPKLTVERNKTLKNTILLKRVFFSVATPRFLLKRCIRNTPPPCLAGWLGGLVSWVAGLAGWAEAHTTATQVNTIEAEANAKAARS